MYYIVWVFLFVQIIDGEEDHIELELFPDYYAMLNVSHEAGMKDIKRSFRKLAMDFHPDKNKSEGAQLIFQELSEAYSILGDATKKAEYDELFKHFYDLEHDDHESSDTKESATEDGSKQDATENTSEESSQDDSKASEQDKESSSDEKVQPEKAESGDLDDETLFKVLKFLAENDYIITKRTRKVPSKEGTSYERQDETRSKRSAPSGSEYRTGSQNNSGHRGHDHAWTNSHKHKPRQEYQNARYSNQFHGSEQVYCKSYVRWEGDVKITSKTCY
jgi:DnaJ-class molecular chaperone